MTMLTGSSWPAVPERALLLIPTGSTEQHGPQLPFDTDSAVATAVAQGVAARLGQVGHPVVVAPVLSYGASGEHQAFAGTLSIGHEALRAVLIELARSAHTWAARVVFVNGHGGNVPTLRAAVLQLVAEGHVISWVPCDTRDGDAHAGRFETSLMLHMRPDDVGSERPTGATTEIAELLPRMREHGVRAVSPTGVLGDARGASAEEGRRSLEGMIEGVLRRISLDSVDELGCLRDPLAVSAAS